VLAAIGGGLLGAMAGNAVENPCHCPGG
jgi:hypothetical protein